MLKISDVEFAPAAEHLVERGLLGWVRCIAGGTLVLEGITVRRTRSGELTLSYPARDEHGVRRFLIRPRDHAARLDLERQILAAIPAEVVKRGR